MSADFSTSASVRKPSMLGIGGAHPDRRGRIAGEFVPGASNPGTMREDVGGGVFNALRTAARRGVAASIHSVRGGDSGGEAVAGAILAAGIMDLSATFLDRATPSYTALLDRDGEPLAALADMELYETGFSRQIRRAKLRDAIQAADAVLCDANLPAAALEKLGEITGTKPLFAVAISPAKVTRLASILPRLSCLFMNKREAEALLGHPFATIGHGLEKLAGLGLARGVVTNGADVIGCFDPSGAWVLRPAPARNVVDATGAGDALAGGTVAALLSGSPLPAALREGTAAAMLAVEAGASIPDFSPNTFAEALALVPVAQPLEASS